MSSKYKVKVHAQGKFESSKAPSYINTQAMRCSEVLRCLRTSHEVEEKTEIT